MEYLVDRSLFYYFLMREITDAGKEVWSTIANDFGVSPKLIKNYEAALQEPVLVELVTPEDIEVYKNFTSGFFFKGPCFGKSAIESDTIDSKLLALQKIQQLFGYAKIKKDRLLALSHIYENDRAASILYALQIIHFNKDKNCCSYAEDILSKELFEEKNSDAGFILLQLKKEDAVRTVSCLKSLPEMLIRPEIMKYLTDKYGGSNEIIIKGKLPIGF